MRARMINTSRPAPRATALNTRSPHAPAVLVLVSLDATVGVTAAIRWNLGGNLDLAQLRLRLLLQGRRQRGVHGLARQLLAVTEGEGQEVFECGALCLVSLFLVDDDPRR